MNKKIKLLIVILIVLSLSVFVSVFLKNLGFGESVKYFSGHKKGIASAITFSLNDLAADFSSAEIAKRMAREWNNDAKLTVLEIIRIYGPEKTKENSYYFKSELDSKKEFIVRLTPDNSIKEKGEALNKNDKFNFNQELDAKIIKISSAEAFNAMQKISTDFKLPILEDNYLNMALVFDQLTKKYQWMCATSRYPTPENLDPKVIHILVNAETGIIEDSYIESKR